jgi:hypothetical protein
MPLFKMSLLIIGLIILILFESPLTKFEQD